MDLRIVQRRLRALGYDLGPAKDDGIRGRKTDAAIKAFQLAHGLNGSGQVGPKTIGKLFPDGRPARFSSTIQRSPISYGDAYPWFDEARRLEGTREIVGARHSRTIMNWADRLGLWYPDDETPWCGLFVAHCIEATLPDEVMPGNPLGARNWLKFGYDPDGPTVGAVVVFWRGSRSGWKGHVGFVASYDRSYVYCLGGNQSNAVNIRKFKHERVLGYRWPITWPLTRGPVASLGHIKATDGNEA